MTHLENGKIRTRNPCHKESSISALLVFIKNPKHRRKELRHILVRVRFPVTSDSTEFLVRAARFRGSRNRETKAGTTKRMINLKAEVKKGHRRCSRAVGRRRSHNGEYRSEKHGHVRWSQERCPRVTRSRVGLWRSKPRIGFLMSRKWLPWMVLVTGISHLWDLCVLLSPRIWDESTTNTRNDRQKVSIPLMLPFLRRVCDGCFSSLVHRRLSTEFPVK